MTREMLSRAVVLDRIPKHGVCAEIGVLRGEFSNAILQIARPKELHLIDPWAFQPNYPGRVFGGRDGKGQADLDVWHQEVVTRFAGHRNVKVHRMFSTEIEKRFPDDYFDWMYIDGNHSYDVVSSDLDVCYRKTKDFGWIAGDDYAWLNEQGVPAVQRAVCDFIGRNLFSQVCINGTQFMLQKDKTAEYFDSVAHCWINHSKVQDGLGKRGGGFDARVLG
jgi:hypothetical protein